MKLDSANNLLFKSLNYFEKNHFDSEYLGDCYSVLGKFYLNLGTPRKALEFFNKALPIFKRLNNEIAISQIYYSVGNAHFYLSNLEKARSFFNSSIALCKTQNNFRPLSSNYYLIAELGKDSIEDTSAQYFVQKAICLDTELESIYGLAFDYLLLGEIYFKKDSLKLAKETILKSLEYSRATNLSDVELDCLYFLVDIEYKEKNYQDALDYNMQINQIYDSHEYADIEKLQEVEKQYQDDKKEYEYALERQKTNYRSMIIMVFICFISLITFLLWIMQRAKAKRLSLEQSKLKEEIIYKNKQLTTNVMFLVNKNEFITSISKKLTMLEINSNNHESTKILTDLLKEIQHNLNDDLWQEFELRFQEVHLEFYKNLDKYFPDLTINERRLAAFLKLNMTTKEISAITNQSLPAIEMARSRLRKKLNIQKSDLGLAQYLAQY